MWNLLYNLIYDKFFPKPSVCQKRKSEEWADYPPTKQMKLETVDRFRTENISYKFINSMKNEDYLQVKKEEDEEDCLADKMLFKKWTLSGAMARQPIHKNKNLTDCTVPLDKRKTRTFHKKITQLCESNNDYEVEEVNHITKNSSNFSKINKNKQPALKVFPPCNEASVRQNIDKSGSTFQSSIRKRLNFLQESYRLSEKIQYMQLLQQQTTKLNSSLMPFTIQHIGSHKEKKSFIPIIDLTKEKKSSIPFIDLTEEKNNLCINRSRENIPWISSTTKSKDEILLPDSNSEKKELKLNSLEAMLRTYPVTNRNIADEILSKHSSATAEKRRQAEMEAAKLKILRASNRKAYSDALEEKMRQYMKITSPAVEEIEPEKEKYVLPELSKEQESKISFVLVPSPASEVLVEKFGLQIKRRDLQTLKGLNWLNDEVINFYMNLIMERSKDEKLPKVYAFNTFFYPKLISNGHASLKRWTKKVDIFSNDLILVPIHLGMHWCMAVIDFRSKEIKYYDSMGSSNNRCLQSLLSYLEDESMDKKKVPFNTKGWEQINVEDLPQQMNGSDCGVFSCMFAEHLSRDCPLLFSQDHMPYFRRKMALEIVEAKLLT